MYKAKNALIVLFVSLFILLLSVNKSYSQVYDIDNNVYKSVTIGSQEWLAGNLNVSKFRNGDEIPEAKTVEEWSMVMGRVFHELYRVTKPNGWVAFEVGEVKNRTVNLDEHVVPLGNSAGFECNGILVNFQEFTKTANIWGIRNMKSGTNTNRIVLFRKPK